MMHTGENNYWNQNGKHQALVPKLDALIPRIGECPKKFSDNKHLDRYRRGVNCYYDLYNNGLCNRRDQFRRLFGFTIHWDMYNHDRNHSMYTLCEHNERRIEEMLDELILNAAAEQGLVDLNYVAEHYQPKE